MAHRKTHAPRRGSLGLRPRKRASEIIPTIRSWPEVSLDKPLPLGFIGYKAGMTHVIMIDDRPGSPTEGKEIFMPVTIIETPPIIPIALRTYIRDSLGSLKVFTDIWIEPQKELEIWRRIVTYKPTRDINNRIELIERNIDMIKRISIVVATNPKNVGGLSKKVPDIVEIAIGGGSISERFKYAYEVLGKPIYINQVFNAGQFIDIIGVTKGKGFQGVIKRFGVKELPRWHKHRKGSRKIGSRSPTIGALSETPQAGQMGFHRRTEYNKRILAIGDKGEEITPSGGFPHYGIVKSMWIMVQGSTIGVPKRPLILRWPIRPPSWIPKSAPLIKYIDLESKMS